MGMGMLLDGFDLLLQPLQVVERCRIVIGHIDDGGDAAGYGRARGGADAGQSAIATGMRLAVNDAGQDQLVTAIMDPCVRGRLVRVCG